jgi:hypothetical protein
MPYVSRLTPLVHNEHMNGGWKDLVLEMPGLKDEIQARSLNVVISSAHHRPVAANTGDKEGQDQTLSWFSSDTYALTVVDLATADGYETRIGSWSSGGFLYHVR